MSDMSNNADHADLDQPDPASYGPGGMWRCWAPGAGGSLRAPVSFVTWYAAPMAPVYPSNAAVAALWSTRNFAKLQQLEDMSVRHDREDYRTVNTDRGPVKGYEIGGARRGKR